MSYVALDLEKMVVLFKAADMHSACFISAMEHDEVTHCIFPIERQTLTPNGKGRIAKLPGFLTSMENRILYRNITGKEPPTAFGDVMDQLYEELLNIPDDIRGLFKLQQQAGPDPLPCDVGMPERNAAPVINIPKAPSIPVAPSSAAGPSIPKAPAIPKAPGAIPQAPKPGGTTARVWAIAEKNLVEQAVNSMTMGMCLGNKAFRKIIIDECEAEGINPGTAATQFGAWKRSKGL